MDDLTQIPFIEIRDALQARKYPSLDDVQLRALSQVVDIEEMLALLQQDDDDAAAKLKAMCATVSPVSLKAYQLAGLTDFTLMQSLMLNQTYGPEVRRLIRQIYLQDPQAQLACEKLREMAKTVPDNEGRAGYTLNGKGEMVPVAAPACKGEPASQGELPQDTAVPSHHLAPAREVAEGAQCLPRRASAAAPESIRVSFPSATLLMMQDVLEREGKATVALEALKTTNGTYRSVRVQFTVRELPRLMAVLMGWSRSQAFRNHGHRKDKCVAIAHGAKGLRIEVIEGSYRVAFLLGAWDAYDIATLVVRQMCTNAPHLTAREALLMVRHIARSRIGFEGMPAVRP